jgi:hypothetical protein
MAWQNYAEKEKEVQETRAKLQRYLEPFNRDAPTPFIEEDGRHYEDRVIPILQRHAPGYEDVRPTKIPEGELRQVTRRDASGRVSYEFFGSPSAWMNDFSGDKRYLKSIMDNRSFSKV